MKTVTAIIETCGGWDHLRTHPIKVVNEGYMPLCVERIGERGPRGLPLVSVAMYGEQAGDMMRDPDLVCEVNWADAKWLPVSFRNDYLAVEHEPVRVEDGKVVIDTWMVDDLTGFMTSWDRDLDAQGFVEAARQRV